MHERLFDDFVDAARQLVGGYTLGDPMDADTTLGPIAQPRHPEELEDMVRDATRGGAAVLEGGRATPVEGRGRFFEPTLVVGPADDARLLNEESFGPIVTVRKVESDTQALRAMARSRYGLTASIWTSDRTRAEHFGRKLDVGTLFMNRCDYVDPRLPWSGVGDSGRGHSLGAAGFDQLTRPRSLHLRD